MDENCEGCVFQDDITGACTECIEGSAFVKQLCPEDIFKMFYMLLYLSGGEMSIPIEALAKFDDGAKKLLPTYDTKTKRYVLRTSHRPQKRGIIAPRKKLIIPGMN